MARTFQSKEEIKKIISNDLVLLERAIVSIFEYQTLEERERGNTTQHNGVGFNSVDARIGSYMAKYIQRRVEIFKKPYGCNLTGNFLIVARKIIPKYSSQLFKIHQQKITRRLNPIKYI